MIQEQEVKPKPKRTAAQEAARQQLAFKPVPQEEKKTEKPMSLGGFGENLLENAWSIAKGFVNMFPLAVKSGAQVFGDPEGLALLAQNPEHLVKAFRDTGVAIKDAVVHPYEKYGARVLYEEPLTPVLDAMTVLSLGGGTVAKMGRLTGVTKLENAGRALASVPEKIAAEIGRGAQKLVGINPETRTGFLRIRRHELSGAKIEAGVWKDRILNASKGLSDDEWKVVEKFVLDGGKQADLLANPRAAAVYNELNTWLKSAREAELGTKGRALLSDEQMLNRVIGELAERRGLDFKGAKALYDQLEVKPLYAPAIRESGGFHNIVNTLSPSVIRKGKVGFLEKWTSSLGADTIKTRLTHAIDDFYKTRANLRMIDRVIQTPGWAKAVKSGEGTLKELLPEQGIYRKYFTEGPAGRDRARSVYLSELETQHGKERATQMMANDIATQKASAQAVNIAIPDKTLRGLIAREFRTTGGDWGAFLRVYDRINDLFRLTATKLSPRWYTGNVIGDALLASLAGSNWGLAKRLIKEHMLPRSLKAGAVGLGGETGNALNTLSDMIGAVDDAARAGIFSKVVADKVRATVGRFAASEDALRTAINEVSLAPDELADLMVRNQQLGEHVARNSRQVAEIDKKIASTKKALDASLMEETKRQAKLMGSAVKGQPLSLRAFQDAKTAIDEAKTGAPFSAVLYRGGKRVGGRGTFYTPSEEFAKDYGAVHSRVVSFQNPLVVADPMQALATLRGALPHKTAHINAVIEQFEKDIAHLTDQDLFEAWAAMDSEVATLAKEAGHDGIIYKSSKASLPSSPYGAGKEAREVVDLSGNIRETTQSSRPATIELQKGIGGTLHKRSTVPSVEIQAKLDNLISLRESIVADLSRNMRMRDIQRVPELARKAEIAEQAMDRANTFLGEYLGLGPIERGVFRRIIPFYPWMKAMSKLAFTFPFIAPGKAFFWHRYASAMTELMGDPELPEWIAPYAPVFIRQNGDTVWARLTSMSPFGSLRTEHFGGVPIPSILAFWQANPFISLGYRLAGGQDVFSQGSIPYGEPLVAINDGETYKFNERGKLERIITQPPAITSTAHLFPVVQMIDQLISNYDVRKGKPVLNADGSVKYPIPFLYRLLDAGGVKLMDRNREKVIQSEKLRVRKALQELKSQYRKSGPEDREYIKGVFQDYSNGEYRRIEANR